MIRPFNLDKEMMVYLRAVSETPSKIEFFERRDARHAASGLPWAMVFDDGVHEGGLTLAVGASEQELRTNLAAQIAALRERDALDDLNVPMADCRDLLYECGLAANTLGVEIDEVPVIDFVREWLRHSNSMAAGWMDYEDQSVEASVTRVVQAHGLVSMGPSR